MAITHSTAVRNGLADYVVDQLDIGGPGKLVFRLAGSVSSPGAAAATLTFSATAFGAAVGGVATANAISPDNNTVGNASPVAAATLERADGTVIVHCSVAASGADINMGGSLTINAGDIVTCTALTYTAAN